MAFSPVYERFSNTQTSIRGVSQIAQGANIVLPTWLFNSAFEWTGAAISGTPVSGAAEFGFPGAAAAPSGGVYLGGYDSSLTLLSSGGVVTHYTAIGSGVIFNGIASISNVPYTIDGSGKVYSLVSGALSGVASFNAASRSLVAVSGTLYTLQSASGKIAHMASSGFASGTVATPMTYPAFLAASGTLLAVAGWNNATLSSGFSAIAVNPVNSNVFAGATPSASALSLWDNNGSGAWSFQASASGAGNTINLGWTPVGATLFGCDPTSGVVRVYGYSFGSLTLSQTITGIVDASAIGVTLDSQNALVCQPTQNQLTPLTVSGPNWITSGTVSVASPEAILMTGDLTGLVGSSSGIVQVTLGASGWVPSVLVSGLGFVPSAFSYDAITSGLAAVGTSGSSGYVYVSGAAVSGFTGSAASVLFNQDQVLVADPTNSLIRIFENLSGTLKQINAISGVTSGSVLAMAGSTVFEAGSGSTQLYNFSGPFNINPVKSSVVSIYNGSGFSSATLGVGATPTAITFDPSGNISVATLQNQFFTVNTSGVASSGTTITQFIGQTQSTPYGFSSLLWASGVLFGTSSLNESFASGI